MSNSVSRNGGAGLFFTTFPPVPATAVPPPGPRTDDLLAVLHRADAADVETDGAVELEGVAAGRRLGRSEDDADLHADLVADEEGRTVAIADRGELAKRLRHEPRLQPHVLVAHLTFDLRLRHQRRDGIDDEEIDGAAADQGFRDLERLLTRVGLRDEEVLDLDPELLRVVHVEGVLGVDERGAAAL